MTLLQGPKHTVLPTLLNMSSLNFLIGMIYIKVVLSPRMGNLEYSVHFCRVPWDTPRSTLSCCCGNYCRKRKWKVCLQPTSTQDDTIFYCACYYIDWQVCFQILVEQNRHDCGSQELKEKNNHHLIQLHK